MSLVEGRCLQRPQPHPNVLEQPTCLLKLQPSHEPPVPGPPQAPVSLKPDSSVERKEKTRGGWGNKEGMQRTTKLLKFNPKYHTNKSFGKKNFT